MKTLGYDVGLEILAVRSSTVCNPWMPLLMTLPVASGIALAAANRF
jgi:hypothetical protein